MADVNANIDINIDSSNALTQLKSLQRQISQFHTSVAKSSESAAIAQRGLQKNLLNSINAISGLTAEMRTVKTSAESFTNSLEKNKFSMREYFRYAGASTKTFGRLFKSEFDTIGRVAEERVKKLQTQYIKMGRDTNGAMQAMAIMPTKLDMSDYATQVQLAAQKQALFNQLMKQGSTNLLNFGKNTQWAGRQLMVGFTLPLMAVGTAAAKSFMDMEAQAIKFKKVYGDLFTPAEETEQALANITELGKQFTKYGVAVSTTVGLAADAAAAGFSGLDLQRQTTEATRLSILGQIESQQALETTISLQNAFGMSSAKLADSINFLNAVENQTVVSLDDITTAIPKVAPVIQQLGGDVKDLAFFMAAMKEGGINASEGANALKSGLASLINPTGKASAMLKSFGINATAIVENNKGDLKATVIEFANALNALDPLNRAQVIEQMFGKFQFARLSALFANVTKEGNQAARVLGLANSSVEELSSLSEKELGQTAESAMNKFKKTVEDLKVAIIPVGKAFLEAVTPIVEFVANILEKFANLSDGTKKVITLLTVGIGAVGPVLLMTFGLLANGVANIIKLFMTLRNGYQRLTGQSQILGEQTQYMTMEQLDAAAAAHSLNQTHATLTQTFTAEAAAIQKLIAAYSSAAVASANFARANPGMMMPGTGAKKFAQGGIISGPGGPTSDSVPIMASNGEAIISAEIVKKYPGIVEGLISGNIPGFKRAGIVGGDKAFRLQDSYELGHFAPAMKMTGSELLEFAKTQTQSVKDTINTLIASVQDGLEHAFDVFSNEVVVQSSDLNQAIGEVGSGKRASTELFKQEAVSGAGAYNAPLLVKMQEAGASPEELEIAVKDLAKEFEKGIDGLKDQTTVTAEEINKITQDAYDVVAKTNEQVRAAREELRKPGAMKEQFGAVKTGGRTQFRGAYNSSTNRRKVNKVVQEQLPGRFPTQQGGKFTTKAAQEAGMRDAAAIKEMYSKLSKETKKMLDAYVGDIKLMSKKVVEEARKAGIDVGQYTIEGIAIGAETKSPSKKAIKVGQDIGRGLEVGMDSKVDDVQRSGEQLGTAATGGTQSGVRKSGARRVSVPQGSPLSRGIAISDPALLSMAYQEDMMRSKVKEQATKMQVMNQRMDQLNKGLMGGTFALTSLAGAGSMFGGTMGTVSQQVMKFSGLLFGLMSVTQLLTQTKMAELVATRLSIASSAMKMAKGGGGIAAMPGLVGKSGLMGNIARLGLGITKFLGPIGLATTAVVAAYGAFKFLKHRSDQAAFAAEGLAKAMTLSKDKVKILADLLGQTPTARAGSGARVSANQLDAKEQTAVDELRSSQEFLDKYKNEIKAIKQATVGEAEIAFNAIALDLSGQGFTDEAIKTYIDALGEEAGKTDVALKFKKIDLTSESGKKAVVDLAKDVTKGLNKAFKGKIIPLPISDNMTAGATATSKMELTKEQQKQLNISSAALANTFAGLTTAFGNQTIKADEYNKKMAEISNTIPQGTVGMMLMDKIMTNLNPEFAKAAAGITDYDTKMLLLRASLVNASVAQSIFTDLMSKNPAKIAAAKAELEKYRLVTDAIASQVVATKPFETTNTTTKEKSPFQLAIEQLKQQRKEMVGTTKAYSTLRNAGVAAGKAFAIAKDPILAAGINSTKVGTKKWKELIKLIKETDAALVKSKLTELRADRDYTRQFTAIVPVLKDLGLNAEEIKNIFDDPSFAQQFIKNVKNGKLQAEDLNKIITVTMQDRTAKLDFETSLQTEEEKFKSLVERTSALIALREKLIDIDFAPKLKKENDALKSQEDSLQSINDKIDEVTKSQLDPLRARIDANSFALEAISRQEDIVNEKYDTQIAALEKIETINQDIANVQKQRMTIADAITRGDISAAAAAVQEARDQQAQSALAGLKNGLTASRDATIAGLGRNKLEKENKDLQYQISVIENTTLLTLEAQKKTIEGQIEATQRKIAALESEAQKLKDGAIYAGQTKQQIADQEELIGLADAAGIKYNSTLIKQLANAEGIAAAIASLDREVTTVHNVVTNSSGTSSGTTSGTSGSNSQFGSNTPWAQAAAALSKPKSGTSGNNSQFGSNTPWALAAASSKVGKMSRGGLVPKYFAAGGFARGTDTVPAMLTPGEFIVNKYAASAAGPMLQSLNESKYPSMLGGPRSINVPVLNNSTSMDNSSTAVYNYTLGFNINGSSSNANDIARSVMKEIKNIDSQRIRGRSI
jgi:TP901 family phage tail tape measure protein